MLEAMLQAKRGDVGGFSFGVGLDVNTQKPNPEAVITAGVDIGGVRGGHPGAPAADPHIYFWHELFRHINASWLNNYGQSYPWTDADRKILANAARKYDAFKVMAMWDIFRIPSGLWFRGEKGTEVYWMVRNSSRLMDFPKFKAIADSHKRRLESSVGLMSAGQILAKFGLGQIE